jgi:hypothetical protein
MDCGFTILQQGAFMRHRLIPWVALLGLAFLPAAVRARETTSDKPTIAVRIASIESILNDARYIAELVGKADEVENLKKLLEAMTGGEGLKGVDPKKPFGFYGKLSPKGVEDAAAVVLLPVADEDAFLTIVGNLLGMKPEKGGDGIYTLNLDKVPIPIHARFTSGYCCVSNSKAALAKDKLLSPAVVLPEGKVGVISATVQIDEVPAKMKQLALGVIDNHLAKEREKTKPGASEEEVALHKAAIDQLSSTIKSVFRDGSSVDLRLGVDRNAGELSVAFHLAAKAGSDLANSISDLAKSKSVAAALVGRDSAASGAVHLTLPAKLRSAIDGIVDHAQKKAVESATNDLERELREILLKALEPTLKSGVFDAGVDLRGPSSSNVYTLVVGGRVKDGAGLEKAIRKIVDKVPDEVKNFITLDAAKAGAVAIHKITPPETDAKMRALFGDNPVYVAIREDAVLVALGDKGLEAIKEAVAAAPKTGRIFSTEAALARLAPLIEKEHRGAIEAAKKAFGKEGDTDKLRFVIEGGDTLQIKLAARAELLKFATAMDRHRKGD